ncbi:MAG: HAD family hydrolase [Agriterribacter sp.]
MLLATDLDGAFPDEQSSRKQQLYRLLRANLNVRLVFVTGRALESVIPILNDPGLPNPDYIICDAGATIVNGHTLEPIYPLQLEIEKKWPGHIQVINALKDVEGILYQQVPQQRRCSYLMKDEWSLAAVRLRLESFNCEIVHAAGQFLDILPAGVNKGSSLKKLVSFLAVKESDVLVASDRLHDFSVYEYGFKGVVVGNVERHLTELTQKPGNICYAESPGAGGILEAIAHFPGFAKLLHTPAFQQWREMEESSAATIQPLQGKE